MSRFALAAVACLLAGMAFAEDKRIMSGVGNSTCGKFSSLSVEEPVAAELTFLSWAQGFMTAHNILAFNSSRTYRSLEGETEQQFARLLAYCRDHPDVLFASAVMLFYNSMPLKR
jgi:hypothetical protein